MTIRELLKLLRLDTGDHDADVRKALHELLNRREQVTKLEDEIAGLYGEIEERNLE